MQSKNNKARPKYKKKTSKEIFEFSRIVLGLRRSSNLIIALEELKQFFPRLRYRVVDDFLMPREEARAYPSKWLIKIRRSIYEGLLRGRSRGKWTLAHELGHVLLQAPGHDETAVAGEKVFSHWQSL